MKSNDSDKDFSKLSSFMGVAFLTLMLGILTNAMSSKLGSTEAFGFAGCVLCGLFDLKIWASLLSTLNHFFAGFGLALLLAFFLGVAMGRYTKFERFMMPIVSALRPIPSAAILPFSILFFSYGGMAMKLFVISYGCLWPMLIQVYQGAKDIPDITVDSAKTLGKSEWEILRDVIVPAIMPNVFVGARIGLAIGLLLAITAEIVILGDSSGIGYLIVDFQRSFKYAELLSATIVIGAVGWFADWVFGYVERLVLPWHRSRS